MKKVFYIVSILLGILLSSLGYIYSEDHELYLYLFFLGEIILLFLVFVNIFFENIREISYSKDLTLDLRKVKIETYNISFILGFLLSIMQIYSAIQNDGKWEDYFYWLIFGLLSVSFFRIKIKKT